MTEAEEQAYQNGSQKVWLELFQLCLKNLGEETSDQHGWVIERAEAVRALRDVCGEVGDNEWDDDIHLYDVIHNHLTDHLRTPDSDEDVVADDASKQVIRQAVDILNNSRHAFRSKQIQQVREMLEKLL